MFGVLLGLAHIALVTGAEWRNFIEVSVPEDKHEGYIVYNGLPRPAKGKKYSLVYSQRADSLEKVALFKVSASGLVTAVQPLSFDKGRPNRFDLTIVLRSMKESDGGMVTTLRVSVQDVNNFPPLFAFNSYNGYIKESAPENTVVMGLENCYAEDRDSSGVKTYKIIKGNERGYFTAEKNDIGGKSFLVLKATARLIRRDKDVNFLTLTVEAEDMGNPPLTGSTTIGITILEVNDHTPRFDKSEYRRQISDDTPRMSAVLKVIAVDEDEGISGEVYYYFHTVSSFFAINAFTGVIALVHELDYGRITQESFKLTVVARDRGNPSKQSSASVIITVSKDVPNYPSLETSDSNQENSAPFFPHSSYHFAIHKSFPVKGSLGSIFALDDDPPGPNNDLKYSLRGSSRFTIDEFSGVLTLTQQLQVQTYILEVRVQDRGYPQKDARAEVKVEVKDANDSQGPPRFNNHIQVLDVEENVDIGHTIFQPSLSNSDSKPNKEVVYFAMFGSGLPFFQVDESTGLVKTAALIDREKQSFYDLMIQARTKGNFKRYSHIYLMINIRGVDDVFPDFVKPVYNASVPEGNPEGTFVTVIHAVDKDNPSVTYENMNLFTEFEMERDTGVIRTKRVLDRATGDKEFLLYVNAIDGGGKSSEAVVNVKVRGAQNSVNKFRRRSYQVSLPEGQGLVRNLLCVAATGSNEPVEYSIRLDADKRFQIDQASGSFSVTDSFNYKLERGYVVQVEAKSESSSRSALATVRVQIENGNESPKFTENSYHLSIRRNVKAGSKLLTQDNKGFAFFTDDKPADEFECTLEEITVAEILDHFKVERVSSECQLIALQNFNQLRTRWEFSFEVRVTDTNKRNFFGKADVTVRVDETNDFAPEFGQSSYWVSVPSNTQSGTRIVQVSATDQDNPERSDFAFELLLEEGPQEDLSRFQIDNEGVVRTVSSELPVNKLFQLKVRVKETGTEQPKDSEVSLKISVYNILQAPVKFTHGSFFKSLPEDAPVGSSVFRAAATRSGSDTGIEYSIVGGDFENAFKINSNSGAVSLAKTLDYESTQNYRLIIRATFKFSDGNTPDATAEVIGQVAVQDVNDNTPKFLLYSDPTQLAVESYTLSGTTVMTVKATDEDWGSFGSVTYTIHAAASNPSSNLAFSINRRTGELKTNREIRYSERKSHLLVLRGTDGGGKQSITRVLISVLNVKKPPEFKRDNYETVINENSAVGTKAIDIRADYDGTALLKYFFIAGNSDNNFCIDHLGVISVGQPLDREKVPSYELTVMVSLENKNDTAKVKIILSDANDDRPSFENPVFTIEVPEDQDVNTNLKLLTATDRDNGENGRVTYALIQSVMSESKDLFHLDTSSGMVTLKKPLDREKAAEHVLYIRARDNGNPQLSDITKLIVIVTDINDNAPRFSASIYYVSLPIDAQEGHHVMQLSATDLDSGENKVVFYNVTDGDEHGVFAINRYSGLLTLGDWGLATIPQNMFTLKVEASNKLGEDNKDEATVVIFVYPPDGPPKYPVSSLSFDVKEGLEPGNKIVSIRAATTANVIYQIMSGNEGGVIQIDQFSGDLNTALELDYEKSPKYELQIRAQDSKGRSADVNVTINVQDVNDNNPFFIDAIGGKINRKAEVDIRQGDKVTQIEAYDLDEGVSMTYKLSPEGEAYFSIDNEGVIFAKRTLDSSVPGKRFIEPLSKLSFYVEAMDNDDPPNKVAAEVRLALANYQSEEQSLSVTVSEDTAVGRVVATVPKYIPGGNFSILYPEKTYFAVNEDGEVILAERLDFEIMPTHLLTVREEGATSRGPLVKDIDLEITVKDVNDNDPRLELRKRHGRINGNSRAGVRALKLQAFDADSGANGLTGYQLASFDSPFSINPLDDTLEVSRPLKKSRYNVKVLPFDHGIPRRRNSAISLRLDVAQLPPRFVRFHDDGYKFEISEAAGGGALVGTVLAESFSGSKLAYSIIDGNVENTFKITEHGEIKVNFLLDFETQRRKYDLTVQALEMVPMGLLSNVNVRIFVLNENDHVPMFDQASYAATVVEDAALGSSVLKVGASDCDCSQTCQCTPGQLKYKLQNSDSFTVDPNTGVISPAISLDFESRKTHIFQVQVSDTLKNKTKHSYAFVEITVTDTNDNPPRFVKEEYKLVVDEEAELGNGLGAVVAKDADQEPVRYVVVAGSGPFQVNPSTGVISLKQKLPSKPWEYTFTVRASDSKDYGETKLVVFIKDKNNNRPVFTKCENVTITENLPAGQVITQVVATDEDRGKNGEIEYSIVRGDENFEINNATGVVTSLKSFDRENGEEYMVVVKAEDGGHGQSTSERLMRYCNFSVTVLDVNDNYPSFWTWYEGSVWQNAEIGTYITRVQAMDSDSGVNSKVMYDFEEPSDKLSISETGVISIKAVLAPFVGTIESHVIASNIEPMAVGERDSKTRRTLVRIYVSELQPPRFTQTVYNTKIAENSPPGSFILQIMANSQNNQPVTYSPLFTWIGASEFFQIDPSTGVITSGGKTFDYEEQTKFILQFRVRESKELFSTCIVEVDVTDVNDNSPKFGIESYHGRVVENSPVGTEVLSVHAIDEDTGVDGEVVYSIEKTADYQFFTMDPSTGVIKSTETFDRDGMGKSHYLIVVEATDKGSSPLVSKTYAEIEIVDDNDMRPFFSRTTHSVSVDEDTPIGKTIYFFTASDQDVGLNARLDFYISEGDTTHMFNLVTVYNPNAGQLTIDSKLDYEQTNVYNLNIIATDGRQTSRPAAVTIKVLDINDNAPVFTKLQYEGSVKEETAENQPVLTVSATDIDTTNDPISYSLDERGQRHFIINSNTGQIRTGPQPLNREETPVLYFTVKATDGRFNAFAGVKIIVIDIDDRAPYFPNPPFVGTVEENKPAGTSVLVVQAVDEDDPKAIGNTELTYTLDNDSDRKFQVNGKTGVIYTTRPFDREKDALEYNVTVRATDKGTPIPLSGITNVTIRITDANDHRPLFDRKEYRTLIPESAYPGYYVTRVNASDGDTGFNSKLEFTIVSGNDPQAFYINPVTGEILVSGILDYENKTSYALKINVSDLGLPQLTSPGLATVFVTILDSNDHPPVFVPEIYAVSVRENVSVGTPVLTVTTTDRDIVVPTQLRFSVLFGDQGDVFEVKSDPLNPRLGILTTTASLDRETVERYSLEITATDADGLSTVCFVTVTVLDVNDHGPHFVPPFYQGSIAENVDSPQFVATLRSYERDKPSNGPPFTYTIINGTSDGNFRIDPNSVTSTTADIFSHGVFRYEEKPEWKLWVQVEDSGTPPMNAITMVYVEVKDQINNNEPFNGSMIVIVNAYEAKFVGGVVAKAYYQDNDFQVDENGYQIASQYPGAYFSINSRSGFLSARENIPIGVYGLFVKINKKNSNLQKPKVVYSAIHVVVQNISKEAIQESSTVQFLQIHRSANLVGDYYCKLQETLAEIFVVTTENVLIFSIQNDSGVAQAINVQFVVINDMMDFVSSIETLTRLAENKARLEAIGLVIGAFGIDGCANEVNKTGVCRNTIVPYHSYTVISGDYGQLPAPAKSLTVVSIDLRSELEYQPIIQPGRACAENPCLNGGTCHDVLPKGFVCQCKHQYRGPLCEETTRTFQGGLGTSYIWLDTLTVYERSVVQLEFSTKTPHGLILYQGPLVEVTPNESRDYMAVLLVDGYIRVVISLGARPLTLNMTRGTRLDDGEWHMVEVRQELKIITITIDQCKNAEILLLGDQLVEDQSSCKVTGKVRGTHLYLNSLWPLQIGGVENPSIKYPPVDFTGFNGCIRKITNNKHMYDLKTPLKVVNSYEGCLKARVCPFCSGKGYCEPYWNKDSVCVCDVGVTGENCQQTTVGNYYLNQSYSQFIAMPPSGSSSLPRRRRELASLPDPLLSEYHSDIVLKIRAKPGTSDSLVFLTTNSLGTEFIRVDIYRHTVRLIFRLAGRMKSLTIPELNVTDSKNHEILIQRRGNHASLQVDYAGKVDGSTGGRSQLMNHGGGMIFAGGLRQMTALRVLQAIVTSHGKAIVETADGQLVSTYSAFSDPSMSGVSLVTITEAGDVRVKKITNATLVRMYQKRTVRAIYNASSQRVVIGSMGVSVSEARFSDNNPLTLQQVTQQGSHTLATHSNLKTMGTYGSGVSSQYGRQTKDSDIDESYEGCVLDNRLNGVHLDLKGSSHVTVVRRNVVGGCPCSEGECMHNSTCQINPAILYLYVCNCSLGYTGHRCDSSIPPGRGKTEPIPPRSPSWTWYAVLVFLFVIFICIILLGLFLMGRHLKVEPAATTATAGKNAIPTGHGTVRTYCDAGAGEEDNENYDLGYLIKYLYSERAIGKINLEHGQENAGIREYKDQGIPPTDNLQFDLRELRRHPVATALEKDSRLGTSNLAFHGSTAHVTHSNHLHTIIASHVQRVDSAPSLSYDEVTSFKDEGLDSDVDDLSHLGSDDEGDSDEGGDWDAAFTRLGHH